MVCALVRGSTRDNRRRWRGQKPLIFMRFHGVFLGSQHEIWPKQHNGKVSNVAYVETVKTTRGNAIVDIVFISGETKVRFTDQDAIQVLNFFEMTYEKVAT